VVALEQPAVDEHPGLEGFDKIGRPGDFTAGGTKDRILMMAGWDKQPGDQTGGL
jgi:hypothetical protein